MKQQRPKRIPPRPVCAPEDHALDETMVQAWSATTHYLWCLTCRHWIACDVPDGWIERYGTGNVHFKQPVTT